MSGQTDTAVKMQASNIDEQGNVLYLDEERLKSKEMGFEPFKNSGKGFNVNKIRIGSNEGDAKELGASWKMCPVFHRKA